MNSDVVHFLLAFFSIKNMIVGRLSKNLLKKVVTVLRSASSAVAPLAMPPPQLCQCDCLTLLLLAAANGHAPQVSPCAECRMLKTGGCQHSNFEAVYSLLHPPCPIVALLRLLPCTLRPPACAPPSPSCARSPPRCPI